MKSNCMGKGQCVGDLRCASLPQTLHNPRLILAGIKDIEICLKMFENFCLRSDSEDENFP